MASDRQTRIRLDSFNLVGSATLRTAGIRLTSFDPPEQAGAAWLLERQNVGDGFQVTFQFRITPTDGADGLAFVVQDSSLEALGEFGGSMGYAGTFSPGIPASLAVELDAWQNAESDFPPPPSVGDPNANHVSVHSRGLEPNSADEIYSLGASTDVPPFATDRRVHTALVDYDGAVLRVFIDDLDETAVTLSVDLDDLLGLTDGMAWVGFTAGTGGATENHDIIDFELLP